MSNRKKFENIRNLIFAILERRQEINFKQTELGREIGLSQKQYSRIETGEVVLKVQVFLQIAHALKINPCDLLNKSGVLKEFSPSNNSKLINQLTAENVELKKRNQFLEQIINKLSDK
jgi:transcriptional regulator with XRE-family HTH domain